MSVNTKQSFSLRFSQISEDYQKYIPLGIHWLPGVVNPSYIILIKCTYVY